MSKLQNPIHGRNHRYGGSDPIPFLPARMPFVNIKGFDMDTPILDGIALQVAFGSELFPPVDGPNSLSFVGTLDSHVFSLDGSTPWDHINILSPGVYYAEARFGWFLDWGKFSINLLFSHSDTGFSVTDSYGFSDSFPTELGGVYPGFGGFPHEQTAVCRRGFIMVDEFATDVVIWAEVTNESGTDRTPSDTESPGSVSGSLFVMKVAESGHSNP